MPLLQRKAILPRPYQFDHRVKFLPHPKSDPEQRARPQPGTPGIGPSRTTDTYSRKPGGGNLQSPVCVCNQARACPGPPPGRSRRGRTWGRLSTGVPRPAGRGGQHEAQRWRPRGAPHVTLVLAPPPGMALSPRAGLEKKGESTAPGGGELGSLPGRLRPDLTRSFSRAAITAPA